MQSKGVTLRSRNTRDSGKEKEKQTKPSKPSPFLSTPSKNTPKTKTPPKNQQEQK